MLFFYKLREVGSLECCSSVRESLSLGDKRDAQMHRCTDADAKDRVVTLFYFFFIIVDFFNLAIYIYI